ncbi:unnamed protein product [Linum trigynum]|uniref:Uncharacterized protein n=1 Tax=Linum trigynum TaxID=586398 RepID=A0AAV2DL99_9ROSI
MKFNFDVDVNVCDFRCLYDLVVCHSDEHVFLVVEALYYGVSNPFIADLLAARDALSVDVSQRLLLVILEMNTEVMVYQLCHDVLTYLIGGPFFGSVVI